MSWLSRLVAGLFFLLAGSGWAGADSSSWRVTRGEVRVTCLMTVGGSFEAKTPSLTGVVVVGDSRPSVFSGDLSVDLRTLDTGMDLRNDHLRNEYLEVGHEGFERAVLSEIKLGDVDPNTFQGRTRFTATFLLHGARRTVTGHAEIHRDGSSVRVEASFPVTLPDYGIAKPRYLGVGVKDEVEVKASLVAVPVTALAGGPR
jgi:polyisoprenoid-binding protein YceI